MGPVEVWTGVGPQCLFGSPRRLSLNVTPLDLGPRTGRSRRPPTRATLPRNRKGPEGTSPGTSSRTGRPTDSSCRQGSHSFSEGPHGEGSTEHDCEGNLSRYRVPVVFGFLPSEHSTLCLFPTLCPQPAGRLAQTVSVQDVPVSSCVSGAPSPRPGS